MAGDQPEKLIPADYEIIGCVRDNNRMLSFNLHAEDTIATVKKQVQALALHS